MTAILEVDRLNFSVATGHIWQKKKHILHDISFSIPRGSATAYLGKNGAGKTSTFRILCGMVRPDRGTIRFDGIPCLDGIPPNRIGFMPEQPYFYRNLTPREMLTRFGRISGMTPSALQRAITHWADLLHIGKVLDQPLSACSKGQVQRIGLTQALMHQPDFILLDEPMSGLDPMGRECVSEVLRQEMARGVTLLFSSHILADAESLCDQVVILDGGRTLYCGDLAGLTHSDSAAWEIECRGFSSDAAPEGARIVPLAAGRQRIICPDRAVRDRFLSRLLEDRDAELLRVAPQKRTLEQAFIELLDAGKDAP